MDTAAACRAAEVLAWGCGKGCVGVAGWLCSTWRVDEHVQAGMRLMNADAARWTPLSSSVMLLCLMREARAAWAPAYGCAARMPMQAAARLMRTLLPLTAEAGT